MNRPLSSAKEQKQLFIMVFIAFISSVLDYCASITSPFGGIIVHAVVLFIVALIFGTVMHLFTRNRSVPTIIKDEDILDTAMVEKKEAIPSSMITYYGIYVACCILAIKLFNILT